VAVGDPVTLELGQFWARVALDLSPAALTDLGVEEVSGCVATALFRTACERVREGAIFDASWTFTRRGGSEVIGITPVAAKALARDLRRVAFDPELVEEEAS
jgi:hypothetical protein